MIRFIAAFFLSFLFATLAHAGPHLTVTGSATGVTDLVMQNTENYNQVSVQFTSVGTGNSVTFEESSVEGGLNWVPVLMQPVGAASSSAASSFAIATTDNYVGRVSKRFFRVRLSTYGSGTVTTFATFKADVDGAGGGAAGAVSTLPAPASSLISTGTITRPANTTVYTANTAWANATSGATFTSFTNSCRAPGAQVLIPQIDIQVDEAPATKLQGILWLFSATPTAINDNAAFTLSSADNLATTGNVQGFPFTLTAVQSGTNTHSGTSLTGITYHAQCVNASFAITGMVQVVNAYTPTSGEVMTIKLHTLAAN